MSLTDIASYLPPYASAPRMPVQNAPVIQPQAPIFAQKRAVGRVSGIEGANAYSIGPDSSELVLDESMPVIWLLITDQNGTKTTVKGFTISGEYTPPKPVTMEDLMTEIRAMSDRLQKVEEGYANGQQSGTQLFDKQISAIGAGEPIREAGKGSGQCPANGKPTVPAQSAGS